MRIIFIIAFALAFKITSAQLIRMRYFHYAANPVGMLVNQDLSNFINAYNSFGPKPQGTPDYRLKAGIPLACSLVPGFSYKSYRNLISTPVFFGGTQISSKGTNIPKSIDWAKNIELAYIGTGIGYLGFLFPKEKEKSYRFPKFEYHLSLNGEWNSVRYKDESNKKERRNYIRPSAAAFMQYNFYPPSTDYQKRMAIGINIQYHTNLAPVNLTALQRDLNYQYAGSLRSLIGDFTVGISFAFINNLDNGPVHHEIKMIKIEAIDATTRRRIESSIDVRDASTNKKIKFKNGYYQVKKTEPHFPQLKASAHSHEYFVTEQFIEIDNAQQLVFQIPMNRIHPEEALGTLYFQHASTTMSGSSSVTLNKVLETLKSNPDITIIIKGHTSSEGSTRLNMRLSRHRAEFVKDFLVSRGANKLRIKTMGLGSTDPIYPNDSEKHKAGNRRVEIFILKIKRSI
jgi:outer membrane protein OmpA-like peptidoglycan-associated protein